MVSEPERETLLAQQKTPMFVHKLLARINAKSRRLILVGVILFALLCFAHTGRRLQWPYTDVDAFDDKAFDVEKEIADEKARVGKICILYGDENPVYERALRTHKLHNRVHGYPMFIQREDILDGYWTKPAHVLSVILRELSKPRSQRLLWLWWFDADTIVLNYMTPLEAFLPPTSSVAAGTKEAAEELKKVNILTTDDWNGLNNGIFAIRVSPYAVELLSGVLAYRDLRANESLTFKDQSAMEKMLKMRKYARYAAKVPQRWFNTYTYEDKDAANLKPFHVRPGDFLVHFAGVGDRAKPMSEWLARSERRSDVWNVPPSKASYPTEVARYWAQYADDKRRIRESWHDAREKLKTFNETAQETLDMADRASKDGRVTGAAEAMETFTAAVQALKDARLAGEVKLNETAKLTPEDVIAGDVDEMTAALAAFEKASTKLIGYVGESMEDSLAELNTTMTEVKPDEQEQLQNEEQEKKEEEKEQEKEKKMEEEEQRRKEEEEKREQKKKDEEK